MNKIAIILTAAALSAALPAAEATNTVDVIALLQAKYQRDMSNETGRVFWHGKRVSHIADPSNEVTIATYQDGKVFRDKAKVTRPIDAVKSANAKLKRTVDKKGIPKKLAEARQRRESERGAVSNVTVTATAGGQLN